MKVLVLGGTGGFGSTICEILTSEGHAVTAAGRDEARGRRLTTEQPGVGFIRLDRRDVTAETLEGHDLVVDATGPFQGQNHDLARTAITAGVNYLDMADDRAFVVDIAALDAEARAAGVSVISGASSVPALSSAIAARFARGMDPVHLVEIAISASSQAAFGRSVLGSMLASAGRTIRHGDGTTGVAMTTPHTLAIRNAGLPQVRRTVLEVDGPDQDLLPMTIAGNPSIRFRAGGELAIHNLAMRGVAWLVGRGVISDGRRLIGLASLARRPTSRMGDGRSAMEVRVTGDVEGRRTLRRWTLIAQANMGPRIPCLVIPEIVRMIEEGHVVDGAYAADDMVDVDAVLRRMPEDSIDIETRESAGYAMYPAAMPRFHALAPAVRAMHDVPAVMSARGRATIVRGPSMAARTIARVFGFPKAARDVPLSVSFEPSGTGERWTRDFDGKRFTSHLTPTGDGLRERFGPFSFRFRLEEREGALAMVPVSWTAFGVPLPRALMPNGIATERETDGRFTLDVPIRMPLIGLIVHYGGWLEPVARGERRED